MVRPFDTAQGRQTHQGLNILGIIPARGGSKGIPRKNLVPLAGKPLIAWTLEAAKGAKHLTRVIVSTDDDEIASVASEYGVEVVRRPPAIAQDDTPMLSVLQHHLQELQGPTPDAVIVLQPTSPLRTSQHIDDAMRLFEKSGADTLVSVMAVPHQFMPSKLMRLHGDRLEGLDGPLSGSPTRRQEHELLFARNGPAVLISKAHVLQGGDLYGTMTVPYVMDPEHSVDIDTAADLAYAEFLLHRHVL